MNRFLSLLMLICMSQSIFAQYVYTIKADSVKITNSCDTAELIIENHTQNVPGFLFNKGRGRTEFRRGAVKLNDSMYLLGGDTLKVGVTALNGVSKNNGNIVLGQDAGQPGNPAILTSDREIPTGGHNIFTTGSGNLIIGNNTNNGARLQVNGITNTLGIVSTTNAPGIQKIDGAWTATADSQYNASFEGNFTSANITGHRLYGYVFQPTLNINPGNPPGQLLAGVKISPTFTGSSVGAARYALEVGGDILMSGVDNVIRLQGGYIGANTYGNIVFLRNTQGYGITVASNFSELNSSGTISLGSQASATNMFTFGRQDVSPDIARTFALFRGSSPSGVTPFTPTTGDAKFIEIGSNSTSGNGYATFQPNTGTATYTSLSVNDYVNQTGTASGAVSMLDLNMGGSIKGSLYGLRVLNTSAQSGFAIATPTAKLHIGAGSAAVGSAPLKFTSGPLLSTPETGAVEYLTDKAYLTITTGAARKEFTLNDSPLTATKMPIATTNGRLINGPMTYAGNYPFDVLTITATVANVNAMSIGGDSYGSTGINTGNNTFVIQGLTNGGLLQLAGRTSLGSNTFSPTAFAHFAAGQSFAGFAPVKFTAGSILTTPENGAVEFDGSELYLTANNVRYKLSKTLASQITTDFGGTSLSAFNAFTTTLTITGAQPGDVVNVSANSGTVNPPSIIITAYVTSANTVTLRAYNASNSAVTIGSDTYKVRVIK